MHITGDSQENQDRSEIETDLSLVLVVQTKRNTYLLGISFNALVVCGQLTTPHLAIFRWNQTLLITSNKRLDLSREKCLKLFLYIYDFFLGVTYIFNQEISLIPVDGCAAGLANFVTTLFVGGFLGWWPRSDV